MVHEQKTYHLYLKFASKTPDRRFVIDDVIRAHNELAARRGHVFIGKAGRALASETIRLLKQSLQENKGRLLIVSRLKNDKLEYFGAPIRSIHFGNTPPDANEVPEYYRDVIPFMSLWLKIIAFEKLRADRVRRLLLASSRRPLDEVVRQSPRVPNMLVFES